MANDSKKNSDSERRKRLPGKGKGRKPLPLIEHMKSYFDKVVMYRTVNPELTARDIAEKLGITQADVERVMKQKSFKARMAAIKERTIDRIVDRHAELVEEALRVLPDMLLGMRAKNRDDRLRLDAARFILEPIFKKLGSGDSQGADEIEFAVEVQDDGTISQKITRRKGGQEI